jgi:hypothetical protein
VPRGALTTVLVGLVELGESDGKGLALAQPFCAAILIYERNCAEAHCPVRWAAPCVPRSSIASAARHPVEFGV